MIQPLVPVNIQSNSQVKEIVDSLRSRKGGYEATTISSCLDYLGFRKKFFPHLVVGGTNGKGSVASILAEIFLAAKRKTGLFITPHLLDVRERISVDSQPISNQEFIEHFESLENRLEGFYEKGNRKLSFFETVFLIAVENFLLKNVEIAIFEAGLGGIRDATASLSPLMSIITNVSEDHMHILGADIEEICREKAGLIFEGTPFFFGGDSEQVEIFRQRCFELGAELVDPQTLLRRIRSDFEGISGEFLWDGEWHQFQTPLRGDVQVENLNSSLIVCTKLPFELRPSASEIQESLGRVNHACRLEQISESPPILVDGSHNVCGVSNLLQWLRKNVGKSDVMLAMCMKANKDHTKIAALLKGWNLVIFRLTGKNYLSLSEARKHYPSALTRSSLQQVLVQFSKMNSRKKCLVFFGSLSGAAKVKQVLESGSFSRF